MTRYAALVAIAFVVRGATSDATTAIGCAGAAVLLAGLILDGGYRAAVAQARRRARSEPRPIPSKRVPLDWLVRAQWALAGLAGIATAVVRSAFHLETLRLPDGTLGLFLNAAVTAATIALAAIFVSSLIDWYWILPRVSGVVRRAPCEEAGGQRWARVTGVWLFHRGVATTIVAGCLYGVFLYMGGQDQSTSGRASWYIGATITATATLAFLNAASRAIWLALNPRVRVGDVLDVHGRECLVVDVSLQGAKYVWLDDAAPDGAGERGDGWAEKEDGSISLEDFGRFRRVEGRALPCAGGGCMRVNWYCRCNPGAYD